VARSAAIYSHAPNALFVVAVVGALTAIFAASIGLVQNDIKRVLAYSTVSQLGYMVLACGVGAFTAGIFHLATHAFFKALLFLGSGSVIHGMSGEQDMRKMGGLKARMPTTHWTMLVGCIAIAGIPPLAGFFSKDEILWSVFRIGGYGQYLWGLGFVAAAMTAFYMFRLYFMTFHGDFRGTPEQEHHLHESPASMTVPLMVLAAGSVVAGLLGIPASLGGGNWIEGFLEPIFEPSHHALKEVFSTAAPEPTEFLLMAASVAIAALGIGVAWRIYKVSPTIADRLAAAFGPIYRLLLNKYYVDELYGAVFVRGLALGGGERLYDADRYVIDGAGGSRFGPGLGVNGIGWLVREVVARVSDAWDRYVVDGAVNVTAAVLDNLSYLFRAVQNGLVQQYALVMIMGVLVLIGAGSWMLGLY
jgi:NADH-quinone oxidoreductase subunit L